MSRRDTAATAPLTRALRGLAGLVLAVGAVSAIAPVHAAEGHNSCTGFIDALPITITTQGTWCLRSNLMIAAGMGNAVRVETNNVTIDCNGLRIKGPGGAPAESMIGVASAGRQNITVRHCTIRGFQVGIRLSGGTGHLVEDNWVDGNTLVGIGVESDSQSAPDSLVRRNRVTATSGSPLAQSHTAIRVRGDVIDNTVDGVTTQVVGAQSYGIVVRGDGTQARGNRVRGVRGPAGFNSYPMLAEGNGVTFSDNRVMGNPAALEDGWGINGNGDDTFCLRNTVSFFKYPYLKCAHSSANLPAP